MSLMNKNTNTLGAGDGIMHIASRKRAPVASARRFATRGVNVDTKVRQKLQEALEKFSTPPESPTIKRSRSVADITTPPKKPQPPTKSKSKVQSHELSRIQDAGRRVSYQLVLNAWRRKKQQTAAIIESRDRLQTQVNQLQLQVGLLQTLRETEGNRRSEAVMESNMLKHTVRVMEADISCMKQTISLMEKKESDLLEAIEKLKVDLCNEKNNGMTITHQKNLMEEAYNHEKHQLLVFKEERNELIRKIEECEKEIASEVKNSKHLEGVLEKTEAKFCEAFKNFTELEEKCHEHENTIQLCNNNNLHLENRLQETQSRNEKLESKIHELKKSLLASKQQKRKLVQDNENLRQLFTNFENSVDEERSKPWWKTTGQAVASSFRNAAYVLFPALPAVEKPKDKIFYNCSIGLGKL